MADWQNPITPFIWLGTALVILLVLLFFLLLFIRSYIQKIRKTEEEKLQIVLKHQKQLLQNSIEIQEKERVRIAADLHDELIGQLHRIKLMNENATLNELLGKSISTARRISHDLAPPLLNQLSLNDLIGDFMQPLGTKYTVLLKQKEYKNALDKGTKLHLFRIFQELITNISKHAQATTIAIYIRVSDKYIALTVRDDGIGFGKEQAAGLGLKNIELRTQILNGVYRFKPSKTKGTDFLIFLKRPQI